MHHVQRDGGRQGPVGQAVCYGDGPGGNTPGLMGLGHLSTEIKT